MIVLLDYVMRTQHVCTCHMKTTLARTIRRLTLEMILSMLAKPMVNLLRCFASWKNNCSCNCLGILFASPVLQPWLLLVVWSNCSLLGGAYLRSQQFVRHELVD